MAIKHVLKILLFIGITTFICCISYAQSPPFRFPNPFNLTSPVLGAVYQRSSNNTGIVKVSGSFNQSRPLRYPISSYNLSAKLDLLDLNGNVVSGVSYNIPLTMKSATSQSRVFEGSVTVSGGWYYLTLEADNPSASSGFGGNFSTGQRVGIGEVFIIAGQSNAQGLENTSSTNNVANPVPTLDAVRVQPDKFDNVQYLTGTDPNSLGIAANFQVQKPYLSYLVSGQYAYTNSNSGIAPLGSSLWYWVNLGEQIARAYNVPVAFFNAAWGGTTIRAWQESTDPNARPLGAPIPNTDNRYQPGAPYGYLKNALKFYGSTYGVRSVLWLQGETDAKALRDPSWAQQRINSSNEYAQKLIQVINQSRQDLKPGQDVAWMVGKATFLEGVSYDDGTPDAQSAITVRQGQEQVITSGINNIIRGPDIDQIKDRVPPGMGGEPTHLYGVGLTKAANAWFNSIQSSGLLNISPITTQSLNTEPRIVDIDQNGNVTTALPSGSRYVWYKADSIRVDFNSPVSYGPTQPSSISTQLVIEDQLGNSTLAQPSFSTSTPPPNNGSPTYQTVNYDCNSGLWEVKFVGGDGSTVIAACPGAFGSQSFTPNVSKTFTLDVNLRTNTTFNITFSQSGGQTITQQFTTPSTCTGSTTSPPPTSGGLAFGTPSFDCSTGQLTVNTTGGNGSTVEFRSPGLQDWNTNNVFSVPTYQRNGTQFTIQARQSGTEITPLNYTTSCAGYRLAAISSENVEPNGLVIYPNPTHDQFTVQFQLNDKELATLSIINIIGQSVLQRNIVGTGHTQRETFEFRHEIIGQYFVRLLVDNKAQTGNILLVR